MDQTTPAKDRAGERPGCLSSYSLPLTSSSGSAPLPCPVNAEGGQLGGFGFVEVVLDEAIDTTAAGPAAQAGTQLGQILLLAGGYDLDIAVFGVADPAAEAQLTGFAVDEPAETDTLYTALDEKVENHR